MPPRTSVAAFAQRFERGGNDFTGGREDDRGVEFLGRRIESAAGPRRAQLEGEFLVPGIARRSVDGCAPVPRHLNRHVRGRAEPVEAEAPALLDAGETQAAEADNAGAEQRGRVLIGEAIGNGVDEIFGCDDIFGVAAIDGVAGEFRMVAEILGARAAIAADAVGAMQPGNSNARAKREASSAGTELLDHADDLVPWNDGRLARRQFAFDDVQVGAANAAEAHADENLAIRRLRHRDVGELQRRGGDRSWSVKQASFHGMTRIG